MGLTCASVHLCCSGGLHWATEKDGKETSKTQGQAKLRVKLNENLK